MPIRAKKFVIRRHFIEEPEPNDFSMEQEILPDLKEDEVLLEAIYLSVDPYMRPYISQFPVGHTMIGHQVALIVQSKNPSWPVGKKVLAFVGWRTYTVVNPNTLLEDALKIESKLNKNSPFQYCQLVTEYEGLPISLSLGMLGLPGLCAYYGFFDICRPRVGETIVISAAAGAIGSHIGQLAKLMNMTVIGITSSNEKCRWLVQEVKFDFAISYNNDNIDSMLKAVAPDGIDCYFDSVGGEISNYVINRMRKGGRIAVCGCMSRYNTKIAPQPAKAQVMQPRFICCNLRMEGFYFDRYTDLMPEMANRTLRLIREKKIYFKESILEKFESLPRALGGMLRGENTGKALVRIITPSILGM